MKILHIMQREKFTTSISGFYDVHFRGGEHEICYLNTADKDTLINPDYTLPQREIYLSGSLMRDVRLLARELKDGEYDYIVLHSLLFSPALKVYLTLYRCLKKTVWIEWGADLYTWQPAGRNIKSVIRKKLEYILRARIAAVVCIFPPDCEYYKNTFPRSKAKVFYAPYCGARSPYEGVEYVKESGLSAKAGTDEPVYVQVGHSAAPIVNHIEVLDSLKKFSGENIRIFLPLNYGNMEYADKVQARAEELFPRKVICLREMMPRDEYFELVKKIDIAVFNTYRQIALGNIGQMIYKNIKLYMPSTSVMYKYFTSNGIPIQPFENIGTGTFDDLRAPVWTTDEARFNEYLEDYCLTKNRVARWVTVYDDLKKDLEKSKET